MRKIATLFAILFLIIFKTSASDGQTHTLDAIHRENELNLPAVIREFIQKNFLDDKIVGQCMGSFAHEGEFEYAIAFFAPKEKNVFYRAILRHDDVIESSLEIVQKNSSVETALTEEVQCLSAMEVKRRNKLFSTMEGIEGHIASKTAFDTICFFIEQTEAACYEYDPLKKQFLKVGGWIH